MKMPSTVIRIPVSVLEKLKERAGSRPIGQMIAEDFLHEPDTEQLIKIKFEALERKINDRLDKIEFLIQRWDIVFRQMALNDDAKHAFLEEK